MKQSEEIREILGLCFVEKRHLGSRLRLHKGGLIVNLDAVDGRIEISVEGEPIGEDPE